MWVFRVMFGIGLVITLSNAFEISEFSRNSTVSQGQNVRLLCKSDSYYEYCIWRFKSFNCEFEWKSGSGEVEKQRCATELSDRFKFVGNYNKYECMVELKDVRASDAGEWRCEMEKYVWGPARGSTDRKRLVLNVGEETEYPPPNTSTEKFPPPNTSTEKYPPPNTSTEKFPPPNTSTEQYPPPNTSTEKFPPPNTSTEKFPPPNTSTEKFPPPNTSTEQYPPPNTSTEQYPPPNTSTEKYPPPNTSTEKFPPPNTSTEQYPPPNTSTEKFPSDAIIPRSNSNKFEDMKDVTDYLDSNSIEEQGEVEFYSSPSNGSSQGEATSSTGIILGIIAAVFAVTVGVAFFAYKRVRRFRLESDWKENKEQRLEAGAKHELQNILEEEKDAENDEVNEGDQKEKNDSVAIEVEENKLTYNGSRAFDPAPQE